ncbi:amino acid adenylation domain-containing protein [Clostridiaceae bacterium M8S5]|nr:amino acid adenylation domain-containing protein [Clostridiaceae bacterium M8S5]
MQIRQKVNKTKTYIKEQCLYEGFLKNAEINPKNIAVIWYENGNRKTMAYDELKEKSMKLAQMLVEEGINKGDLVAICLPKGIEQIISVLGILACGAVYVPIGVKQPVDRKKSILDTGKIEFIITDSKMKQTLKTDTNRNIVVVEDIHNYNELNSVIDISTKDTAYIIFTSGSTGIPKGVVISHESAYNTIADINNKFKITEKDTVIAVSELDFDLSVYDIFGLLSVGGKIVLLDDSTKLETTIWKRMIKDNDVTIWNTVPALFKMLMITCQTDKDNLPLKKVFLSGDWIDMDLYEKMKDNTEDCKFISLGGATEASIWSNYYEVIEIDKNWKSIPYGMPLSNQKFRIVDENGKDCEDYVVGELWIGGTGVAKGYLNQEVLTKEKFIVYEGERWYKTGDLGRYDKDGVIEFLGRKDNQIKINGFRIEIGEIENILKQHEYICDAVVTKSKYGNSQHLIAGIVPNNNMNNSQTAIINKVNKKIEPIFENQALIVEQFIFYLLELQVSKDKQWLYEKYNQYTNTIQMWLRWLTQRQVIKIEGGEIIPAKRFNIVFYNIEKNKVEFLFDSIDIYKKILLGETPVFSLLENQKLSPEHIAMNEKATTLVLDKIIDKINEIYEEQETTSLKIAILDSRTGLVAQKIINRLSIPAEITLFDENIAMHNESRIKFKDTVSYEIITEGIVNNHCKYSYDIVIAVNALHRYKNPIHGILLSKLLLDKGGYLLALEYSELAPIALVTSGLLEDGFKNLYEGRSRKYNPLLLSDEWVEFIKKAGFEQININTYENDVIQYIQAKDFKNKTIFNVEDIMEFAKDKLPEYMVPDNIEILPWVSLTDNGKIDRNKIAKQIKKKTNKENYHKPLQGTEEEIAHIWESLIQCNKIGRKESFFEVGGDSLIATQFLSEIKKIYDIEYTFQDMFQKPRLFQVADKIDFLINERGSMVEGEI